MLVVDVETTGLDTKECSILSIGALDFDNPSNQFYIECQVFSGARIAQQALEVNGFTEEQINDSSKPTVEGAVKKFLAWVETCSSKIIGGENSWFDREFLIHSCRRFGIKWPLNYARSVDLHTTCYNHLLRRGESPEKDGLSILRLNSILEYTGLPQEPDPHNALTGAKMSAEAFSRLLYGKPLLDEFKRYPLSEAVK